MAGDEVRRILVAIAAAFLLSGCATPGGEASGGSDPYEAVNRRMFEANLKVDKFLLRPSAERYVQNVPEGVRDSIHNALENLALPTTFANDLLQGKPARAGQTVGRFVLNSTFGAAGLFDVAARVGIAAHKEDFGQTLAVWGVKDGPYLMLPLLGPSSPRDAAGAAVDFALDPTLYLKIKQHIWWALGREYVTILDARARNLESLDEIERDSLDFYAATRSLYRQMREKEIRNGTGETAN